MGLDEPTVLLFLKPHEDSSFGLVSLSSQGEYQPTGAASSGVWKMSSAQIICTQVVPVLDRVLMTMSPSRNGKPSHLALSSSGELYRQHRKTPAELTS